MAEKQKEVNETETFGPNFNPVRTSENFGEEPVVRKKFDRRPALSEMADRTPVFAEQRMYVKIDGVLYFAPLNRI